MNILLYPNLDKESALSTTAQAAETIRQLGAVPMLDENFRDLLGETGCFFGKFAELLAGCDVLLAIGGDGTILRAARHAVAAGRPLLGINAGHVGFLTQLEPGDLSELRRLIEGRYTVHQRMMLEAELTQGEMRRRYAGLNDIVLSRGDSDRIVDIDVHQGQQHIARHRADGLIFATATGSTAYSLSAGGPIVDPSMNLMVMTAVCSHTTWGRSMVLPTSCEYEITDRSSHNPKGLIVTVDGRRVGKLRQGQSLLIRKSTAHVPFIDLGICSFYENVNKKLNWGR